MVEGAWSCRAVSSGLERMPPNQARRRGHPHRSPRDRVRYRAPCAYLTPSPALTMWLPAKESRVARTVQAPSLQAAGPHTARRLHCRTGMSGVAVDRAQPDGDQFEKQQRRPPPRTTKPGRPRHDSEPMMPTRCFSGLSPVTATPLMAVRHRALRGDDKRSLVQNPCPSNAISMRRRISVACFYVTRSIRTDLITTGASGRFSGFDVGTLPIAISTSIPSTSSPNTLCRSLRWGVGARVMKN